MVSGSSAEPIYYVMANPLVEVKLLQRSLIFFWLLWDRFIQLYCDNQVVLNITAKQIFFKRIKHIKTDCHFTRYALKKTWFLRLILIYFPNPVDTFTKGSKGSSSSSTC